MECKDYRGIISVLGYNYTDDKIVAALEDAERLLLQEFSERSGSKNSESIIFNNITAVESLVCALLSQLESSREIAEKALHVLSLACKYLQKKLTVDTLHKIINICSTLGEKSITEKNWCILFQCFTVFNAFDSKIWMVIFANEQSKLKCLKIIQLAIDVGKEELSEKNKQDLSALHVLCIDVFCSIIKTSLFRNDDSIRTDEWFMLLLPLLFGDNVELRSVALNCCELLKKQCLNKSFRDLPSYPNLKEQIKIYAKILVHFAQTNQSDWVNLWCFLFELLGDEFSAKKNNELINKLLEVEETAFRSSNMSTRYNAFIGWKFLVSKFIETSIEDASKRLKLLLQPLVSSNSKTMEICAIKFDVWWLLIVGIEPCLEKHASNVFYNFLNFCFGPVSDPSALNNVRINSNLLNNSVSSRRTAGNMSSINYPLVTLRRMKSLDLNRTDALAQILNLDPTNINFKLKCFKSPAISQSRIFISLSKMLIHSVGECTVLIVDSKEMKNQEKKCYLKEIWKNLLLHLKKIDKMPHCESDALADSNEKHEKVEMMKNLFRILIRIHELSVGNQNLALMFFNIILDMVLSQEIGISVEVLTSRMYYIGTEDLLMGTPLLIMLDIFLSPVCLSIRNQNQHQKPQSDTLYYLLLSRILCIGIGPKETTLQFTQAVMKRLDIAANNSSVEGNLVKTIWIMVAKSLSCYVGLGKDVNQGTDENANFKCLFSVLLFPITYSKTFLSEREVILKKWSQLFQALQKNIYSSNCSFVGNEICNIWCGRMYQEILKKKAMTANEILHILSLVTSAIEQIRFRSLSALIIENSVEEEKYICGHLQQCFQLMQMLTAEVQKMKETSDVYFEMVSECAKSILAFCEHLQVCPPSYMSIFVEQIQFFLSVPVLKSSASSVAFCKLLQKVWNNFMNSLINSLLAKETYDQIISLITPVLKAALCNSDHNIHLNAMKFCHKENILLEGIEECGICKRELENRKEKPILSIFGSSAKNDCDRKPGVLQEMLKRPLTKHQREVFKERRDDIPALYQDLTQDSQPSFIDISEDVSQETVHVTTRLTETTGKSEGMGGDLSFQSAFKSPIKINVLQERSTGSNWTRQEKIENLFPKCKPLEENNATSLSPCNIQELKGRKENKNEGTGITHHGLKEMPIKMLISKLTTGKPEVRSVTCSLAEIKKSPNCDYRALKQDEVKELLVVNSKSGNPPVKVAVKKSSNSESKGKSSSTCRTLSFGDENIQSHQANRSSEKDSQLFSPSSSKTTDVSLSVENMSSVDSSPTRNNELKCLFVEKREDPSQLLVINKPTENTHPVLHDAASLSDISSDKCVVQLLSPEAINADKSDGKVMVNDIQKPNENNDCGDSEKQTTEYFDTSKKHVQCPIDQMKSKASELSSAHATLNNDTIVKGKCDVHEDRQPQIMCDKEEYIRLLSLMPQTGVTSNDTKSYRISTRSDWARRFGSSSKLEGDGSKKHCQDCEKDIPVGNESTSDGVLLNNFESPVLLESQDLIENSQENKDTSKETVKTACFVKVPKLVLAPGSVLTGAASGGLMITEKISPVSFRVSNKCESSDGEENCIASTENNRILLEEGLSSRNEEAVLVEHSANEGKAANSVNEESSCISFPAPCTATVDHNVVDIEEPSLINTKSCLVVNVINCNIEEPVISNNEHLSIGDNATLNENNKSTSCAVEGAGENVKKEQSNKKNDEKVLFCAEQCEEDKSSHKKTHFLHQLNIENCFSTVPHMTENKESSSVFCLPNAKDLAVNGENEQTNTEVMDENFIETVENNFRSTKKDAGNDGLRIKKAAKRRKKPKKIHKSFEIDSKKRCVPEDTPEDCEMSDSLNSYVMMNNSPPKGKDLVNKNSQKPDDSAGNKNLLSGRAAQLVGLALSKNQTQNNSYSDDQLPVKELHGTEETDILYLHSSDGQEMCNWVKHVPHCESSPVRTNLKRRHPNSEEDTSSPPLKKCVRFADPVITQELHFRMKGRTDNVHEPKSTYRIVRTKKGKLYVQKNGPNIKEKLRHSVKSVVPSAMTPVWPSLKYCTNPLSDVIKHLVDTPESMQTLSTVLVDKGISTVGELCSLCENDIKELPIKIPQVIVVKCVMKYYEDKIKSVQESEKENPVLQNTTQVLDELQNLKCHVSSLSPADVVHLLKETMSPSSLKEIVDGLLPSSSKVDEDLSFGKEDKITLTDEFAVPSHHFYLDEEFKKKNQESDDKSELVNEVLKIIFCHSDLKQILKNTRDICMSVHSRIGSEDNGENIDECIKLIHYLNENSALNSEVVHESDVQDTHVKNFSASKILPAVYESLEKNSVDAKEFQRDVCGFLSNKLLVNKELCTSICKQLLSETNLTHSLQNISEDQLISCAIDRCGDRTVVESLISSMNFEKVMEIMTKVFSPCFSEDEKYSMKNIISKLLEYFCKKMKKSEVFSSVFAHFVDIVEEME